MSNNFVTPCCDILSSRDTICWNTDNECVQCHRCGAVYKTFGTAPVMRDLRDSPKADNQVEDKRTIDILLTVAEAQFLATVCAHSNGTGRQVLSEVFKAKILLAKQGY